MTNAKSNINEQIISAAIKSNPKKIKLIADSEGNIHIDKERNPDVYDWAVNG